MRRDEASCERVWDLAVLYELADWCGRLWHDIAAAHTAQHGSSEQSKDSIVQNTSKRSTSSAKHRSRTLPMLFFSVTCYVYPADKRPASSHSGDLMKRAGKASVVVAVSSEATLSRSSLEQPLRRSPSKVCTR